jgi:cyclopropane fatty-acyl-phospholipid synthase-like methyltransferase
MYYKWRETKDFFWLERAMFNSQILTYGGNLLEICCGDGFNSNYIYSGISKNITAIDLSAQSIIFANQYNNNPRVIFKNISISKLEMQEESFNNIIMDAVIEQMSIDEQYKCLNLIANLLTENGIFSGVTILKNDKENYLKQNKNQFDLNDFKHF